MGDDERSKRATTTTTTIMRRGGKRNKQRQRQTSDDHRDEDDPMLLTSVAACQQMSPEKYEYYDHNRNLTTNPEHEHQAQARRESAEFESRREVKTTTTTSSSTSTSTAAATATATATTTTTTTAGGVQRAEQRYRENVSPMSSTLSTQSGDSARAHFHCEPYGACQLLNSSETSASDHSTERMSQTSLAAAALTTTTTTTTAAATTTMTNEGSQEQAERAVKFQLNEVIDMQQVDAGKQPHTAITIQEQDSRDQFEAHLSLNRALCIKTGAQNNASFVRQLGRRVSLFPQKLARQMTWADGHERGPHHLDDDTRRHSLPVPSGGAPEVDEMSPLHSHVLGTHVESAPATVAGVGGTITTVTRSKRKTAPLPRLVAKNGQVNLFLDNIDRRQYMRDLFTTMIDIKWRYNLMAAAFGFVFSWLFFACIWYLVLYFHNDLEHENDPNWSPCIVNVYSFPAALLFSIETQSTLGFGSRIISVECPGAILIFCSQLIFGVVVECLIVGMVFAKLSRPTKRSQTIMYSKYATVCLREGRMCLTFRVGDVRSKSHIIGATLRASLVSSKVTQEGELIPFYHHKLKVIIDDCKNSLLLIWPVTIVHIIDNSSPFYKLNAHDLLNFKFEIITVLEGTVESTGQSIQVRSSYLPSEVKWGYRFEPIVSTHGYGRYAQTIIDYNKFNRIIEVPTPKCSALEYYADQATLCANSTGQQDTCVTPLATINRS